MRRSVSELSTSGKTRRGQGAHHRATMPNILKIPIRQARPYIDELDAKMGHVVGVGNMGSAEYHIEQKFPSFRLAMIRHIE